MHVVFVPYGIKRAIEHFDIDLQAQKFKLRIYKEGEKDKFQWMQGGLRIAPFGIYDYVFPKEDIDAVLTTLGFNQVPPYNLSKSVLLFLRRALKLKKIPKFKTDKKYLWIRDGVSLIPLGIREDGEHTETEGELAGWTHEAI